MVKNFFINLQRQNHFAAQAAAFGQRFFVSIFVGVNIPHRVGYRKRPQRFRRMDLDST